MEVDAKVVADCAQVSTVSVLKWRRKGTGPEFTKTGGRYSYGLGAVIRWAIGRAVTPLREEIDALKAALYFRQNGGGGSQTRILAAEQGP